MALQSLSFLHSENVFSKSSVSPEPLINLPLSFLSYFFFGQAQRRGLPLPRQHERPLVVKMALAGVGALTRAPESPDRSATSPRKHRKIHRSGAPLLVRALLPLVPLLPLPDRLHGKRPVLHPQRLVRKILPQPLGLRRQTQHHRRPGGAQPVVPHAVRPGFGHFQVRTVAFLRGLQRVAGPALLVLVEVTPRGPEAVLAGAAAGLPVALAVLGQGQAGRGLLVKDGGVGARCPSLRVGSLLFLCVRSKSPQLQQCHILLLCILAEFSRCCCQN
mmetsp:Transcript_96321/g.220845  ORF Transcript_96321/g.220845 Transcript_96321/m.220845 type:complete len:274 (+) Transcript_96321:424-1245(+)